jgi:excinuclease ABC subunit C
MSPVPLLQQPDRLRARLKEVPSEPGCYLMRDGDDRIRAAAATVTAPASA